MTYTKVPQDRRDVKGCPAQWRFGGIPGVDRAEAHGRSGDVAARCGRAFRRLGRRSWPSRARAGGAGGRARDEREAGARRVLREVVRIASEAGMQHAVEENRALLKQLG